MGLDRSSAPSNRYGWLLLISFHSKKTILASLRGLLEFHSDVHQADLLSSAFTQSRKILVISFCSSGHVHTLVKMSTGSALTHKKQGKTHSYSNASA